MVFFRIKSLSLLSALLTCLFCPLAIVAQTFEVELRTDTFTDYVLSNDSLNFDYRFEVTIPYSSDRQTWRVLEQEVVPITVTNSDDFNKLALILADVTPESPVIHIENPGIYRKQRVASLLAHVVRSENGTSDRMLVTRKLRIRVYTNPIWDIESEVLSKTMSTTGDSPLATGTWYKIPLIHNGIHQIDRSYLQSLGVEVASIDPRNIQIWGTDGYELARLNSASRPEFSQIPIIVNGENNGNFGASDVIIFYGNSPNRVSINETNGSFSHRLHPYSNQNYLFLTVGTTPGARLNHTTNVQLATRTITEFRDFIWKEEELRRPDNRTKSGNQWLGQQFSPESFARTQTILLDTIPGFVQGSNIQINAVFAARSTRSSRFDVIFQNNTIGGVNTNAIIDLNSSTARAATTGTLVRTIENVSLSANNILEINATYNNAGGNAFGWLDWIRVELTRTLTAKNNRLQFYTPFDGSPSETANYILTGFSNLPIVMDVTNPTNPSLLRADASGNNYVVKHTTSPGRTLIAQTQFIRPASGVIVPNQNIRGLTNYPNYIIVTSDEMLEEAKMFAEYRRTNGDWEPVVVTQSQIFNEFGGGVPDPTATRDYVRYLYLRAGLIEDRIPQHLLLFGDTTFDYKGIQSDARMRNLVFTFQSDESYIRTTSYGSDDYFVLLDSNEGLWLTTPASSPTFERIDMGVGRLPVQTRAEARLMIDKIQRYEDPSTFGDWRNLFTFTSDDDINGGNIERDLHVWNADGTAERIDRDASGVRVNKIYQISYPVINTPLGRLAPEANQAFVNAINNGTLAMNYSGHGSETLLSAEQLFRAEDINRLNNVNKPTIFVTATCEFGRYDDPDAQSGAELLMLWHNGGAIASFTTTRVVFTSANPDTYNFGLNIQLTLQMVRRDSNGLPQTMGEIYRNTKNTTVGATFNSRMFILLGDPAMRIGLPKQETQISTINDVNLTANPDTVLVLRALDQATLTGNILSPDGSINTGFNGEATVQVYDADRFIGLPNFQRRDISGCYTPGCHYRVQNDVIFNGRVSVTNGEFSSRFIIPNDIAYSNQSGRVLVYGFDETGDAVGSFSNIIFNGRNADAVNDNTGPEINIYLNNTDFSDGGIVNSAPRLIVDLVDQSGINTAGAGVGHELVAYLSKRPAIGPEKTIILNNFYRSELDDFTKGRVEYPLDNLETGNYTLRVRAWDVFNNMNENEVAFEVTQAKELEIRNVYNYPNPMSNYTRFVFEHNLAGQEMDVLIRVYTLSGRPVARIQRQNLITSGNLVQLDWAGRDNDNNLLAAGTYLYHVQVKSNFNGKQKTQEKIERLVIIR